MLLTSCISLPINAVSFNAVSSWFSAWQEESFFEEATCGTAGTLELTNNSGPITIKTWSVSKIVIEATKSAKEKDLSSIEIKTDIDEQKAIIKTVYHDNSIKGSVSYTLMIPEHTNVIIRTDEGAIKIRKVHGTIEAQTNAGTIDIEQAARSINAYSRSGSISVSYTLLPLSAHIRLTSDNGNLTLALPKHAHARLTAKALKGTITSEQSITLAPQTVKLDRHYWKRVRTEISGLIGNGGATIELITQYGNIKISE